MSEGDFFNTQRRCTQCKISIIIHACDCTPIVDMLGAALSQTIIEESEIIIINSSNDATIEHSIDQYARHNINIIHIRSAHSGNKFKALNVGISIARGLYITTISQHDRFSESYLQKLTEGLDNNTDCFIAYGNSAICVQKDGIYFNSTSTQYISPSAFAPSILLYRSTGLHTVWRRSLHNKIGLFNVNFSASSDWDFSIRTLLVGKALHVPAAQGLYLIHPTSSMPTPETISREDARIRQLWRTPEYIETLYSHEGAPTASTQQRAYIHYDMGIRALAFYTPWSGISPECDVPFARRCFLHALLLNPSWSLPKHAIALLDASQGQPNESATLLRSLENAGDGLGTVLVQRNRTLLNESTRKPSKLFALQHAPSPLTFPPQLALAAGNVENDDYTLHHSAQLAQPNKRIVLLFGEFFWPSRGGIETFLEELSVALHNTGYAVYIITNPHPERDEFTLNGIQIIEIPLWSTYTPRDEYYFDNLCSNNCIYAAITIGHPNKWMIPTHRTLCKYNIRTITIPSINIDDAASFIRGDNDLYLKFALHCADTIVRCSESGIDAQVLNTAGISSHYIPHAVTPEPTPQNFRDLHGFQHDVPLLVMVSNFWPIKNHLGLLQILAHDKTAWQLAIIGNPHMQDYYASVCAQARKDPRVRIIGLLPRDQTLSAIRDADVLLLPSKGESAGPYVVLEAMALGTPWIATPSCNAVNDEAGGLVVDLEQFPRAIHALLRDKEAATALGQLGKAHWESCFTWKKSLGAFTVLIEQVGRTPDLRMPASLRRANTLIRTRLLGKTA